MTDLIPPRRNENLLDEKNVPILRFARYLEDNASATNTATSDISDLEARMTALEARVTTLEGFH